MSTILDKISERAEKLPSGVGLIMHPQPQAVSVAIGIWARIGGRYEQPQKAGISHFVEHLLFKGTRKYSCEQLKQHIEGVGGSLNGFTGEEFTCYMAKVPHLHTHRALKVLADMVLHSRFAPADIEKEREVILEEIRMYEDTPGQHVHDLFSALLWPNHPLGTLLSGTLDTVKGISQKELVGYWRKRYQTNNLLVACVGNFEPEKMRQAVSRIFPKAKAGRLPRFARAPRFRPGPHIRIWNKKTEQVHLCLGTPAVARTHPSRFATELLHVLLGANMSSRLFREVREKRGLVYEIGTHIKRFADTGAFVVSAGCDPGKVLPTVKTIFAELSRIRKNTVSSAELSRAKEYYAGQLIMGLEDPMDHMLWIGEQAIAVGRATRPKALLKHLEKVSRQDIRRVARQLFETPKIHMAVVGPLSEPAISELKAACRIQ